MTLLTTTYDPATHKLVIEILQGIVAADYRKWEELATPDEFVRWAKSRASHALSIIAAAPAAPSGWISVFDRMPDEGDTVLVFKPNDRFREIDFDTWDMQSECPVSFSSVSVETGLGWNDTHDFYEISHWMPIPAPPAPKEG